MQTRVVQADARKRMTLAELSPSERYFVEEGSSGDLILHPFASGVSGNRIVRADARKRITLSEFVPGGVYLVTLTESGSLQIRLALVVPQSSMSVVDIA